MDWANTGSTFFTLVLIAAGLSLVCALAAGLMVAVSRPLVGFRVPFLAAFKAVLATMAVAMLLRIPGGALGQVLGPLAGAAFVLAGVIVFLAWYLDRHVPRPDGTRLGIGYGYRLACVHAVLLVILNLVASLLLATNR